jgi:hypothetical protein
MRSKHLPVGLLQNPQTNTLQTDGSMLIPVVVNVLYRTAAENISDAQIQSQIDVLNEDLQQLMLITILLQLITVLSREIQKSVMYSTRWSVSKQTKQAGATNDAMKKNNRGGINPTSPTTKLIFGFAI